MTYTLFNLTYELAVELGIVDEGTASGGSTTTIDDTTFLLQADDYWKGGTAWILYDAGAAGALPEGQYSAVTGFAVANNRATINAITAVAQNDRYAIADATYPLPTLIQSVNRALRDINIETTDTTTIDSATSQTEYTLPDVASLDLREVWIETSTANSDDNRWGEIRNWIIQKTITSTADELILPFQPIISRDIKLVYMAPHGKLHLDSDELDDSVHMERVIFRAAWYAMNRYIQRTESTDEWLIRTRDDYMKWAKEADWRYPILGPPKKGRINLVDWGAGDYDPAPGENTI